MSERQTLWAQHWQYVDCPSRPTAPYPGSVVCLQLQHAINGSKDYVDGAGVARCPILAHWHALKRTTELTTLLATSRSYGSEENVC